MVGVGWRGMSPAAPKTSWGREIGGRGEQRCGRRGGGRPARSRARSVASWPRWCWRRARGRRGCPARAPAAFEEGLARLRRRRRTCRCRSATPEAHGGHAVRPGRGWRWRRPPCGDRAGHRTARTSVAPSGGRQAQRVRSAAAAPRPGRRRRRGRRARPRAPGRGPRPSPWSPGPD